LTIRFDKRMSYTMRTNVQLKIYKFLNDKSVKRLTKNTQEVYWYALLQLDNYCKKRKLTVLDPRKFNMDDYVEWLYKQELNSTSIRHYLTIVKMLFKFLGHPIDYTFKLSQDEIKAIKIKRLRRWFSEDEIEQCLNYEFKNNRVQGELLIRLMIETAARVREISRIIAENIDLNTRTIWVTRTKTDPRTVFFSPYTAELLRSYRLQHINWTGRIFPHTSVIRKMITDMLQDLGLKEKDDGRGPHTFRHYAATWLYYEGGMKITELATLMGATVKTIQDVYLHPTPTMLRKRVDKAWGWEDDI